MLDEDEMNRESDPKVLVVHLYHDGVHPTSTIWPKPTGLARFKIIQINISLK
jgi:hypothetical protein